MEALLTIQNSYFDGKDAGIAETEQNFQDALETGESGENLIKVARQAHLAEQKLASLIHFIETTISDIEENGIIKSIIKSEPGKEFLLGYQAALKNLLLKNGEKT